MKSTFDKLNAKDKALLTELYEMDHYKALVRLMKFEADNIAAKCLSVTPEGLPRLQGQADSLSQLTLAMKDLYKQEINKDKN